MQRVRLLAYVCAYKTSLDRYSIADYVTCIEGLPAPSRWGGIVALGITIRGKVDAPHYDSGINRRIASSAFVDKRAACNADTTYEIADVRLHVCLWQFFRSFG